MGGDDGFIGGSIYLGRRLGVKVVDMMVCRLLWLLE